MGASIGPIGFELLERRTRTQAAVDRDVFFSSRQFPVIARVRGLFSSESGWATSEKDGHQPVENSLVHRPREYNHFLCMAIFL